VSQERLVIVGSGPAGLTAAIYTSRATLAPLVIEGTQPGGQLMITTDIENFPGFPEGISGPELMQRMRAQAERFGARFRMEDVTGVTTGNESISVVLGDEEITTDALIIATGASARYLGLESERRWRGRGVSACATCDGFFFKDKQVAVVGGGDTAAEEAIFLTHFATRVWLIHRRDELRASKYMQKLVFAQPRVELVWNSVVKEVIGEEPTGVTGLRLQDVRTGEERFLPCHGVFMAIGHDPNTGFARSVLDVDASGYIRTTPGSTKTVVPGIFAAGDCQDSVYRQAVSAAGSGCMAAIEAERFLAARGH
jgi:thioredoxin reductase (NADPH)